jgi:hypothetical protein
MNNPNESQTPAPLIPCIDLISEYLRKIDREGLCSFEDSIRDCRGNEGDLIDTLFQTLWTRWTVDILENSGTSYDPIQTENLEDRENAFAVLERAENFGTVAFAGEFLRIAPYILRNIHKE